MIALLEAISQSKTFGSGAFRSLRVLEKRLLKLQSEFRMSSLAFYIFTFYGILVRSVFLLSRRVVEAQRKILLHQRLQRKTIGLFLLTSKPFKV